VRVEKSGSWSWEVRIEEVLEEVPTFSLFSVLLSFLFLPFNSSCWCSSCCIDWDAFYGRRGGRQILKYCKFEILMFEITRVKLRSICFHFLQFCSITLTPFDLIDLLFEPY
jgi:hypothetical protein